MMNLFLPKFGTADDAGGQQHPNDPNETWEDDLEEPTEEMEEDPEEQPEEGTGEGAEDPEEQPKTEEIVARRLRELRAKDREKIEQLEALAQRQGAAEEALLNTFAGLEDPYTGKTIKTTQDVYAYQEALRNDQLKQSGLSPEQLERIVSQRAEEVVQNRMQEYETRQQAENMLNQKIAEISRVNPNVKTVDDLSKLPFKADMDNLFYGGTVTDLYLAYKIASEGYAAKKPRDKGGKDHLIKTGGNAGGSNSEPPPEVMKIYKDMMPNISKKEIIEHWRREN